MTYFKNPDDVHHFIGGIFKECVNDPELAPKFADTGVILKFHYTDPDVNLLVDFVNSEVYDDPEEGPRPNIEMFMTSDVAHEYWLGKVNVSVALAKGQMRAKGPVPKILKLVPLTKHVFSRYTKMIEDANRPELLVS